MGRQQTAVSHVWAAGTVKRTQSICGAAFGDSSEFAELFHCWILPGTLQDPKVGAIQKL